MILIKVLYAIGVMIGSASVGALFIFDNTADSLKTSLRSADAGAGMLKAGWPELVRNAILYQMCCDPYVYVVRNDPLHFPRFVSDYADWQKRRVRFVEGMNRPREFEILETYVYLDLCRNTLFSFFIMTENTWWFNTLHGGQWRATPPIGNTGQS